jgi:hypothetical protein
MARTVVTRYVSDLTGKDIEEGEAATMRIVLESDSESVYVIDAMQSEIADLLKKATKTNKPGRKSGGDS